MEQSSSPQVIQLSQTHLQLLADCPRKFQYLFLDQLAMPQLPEMVERQQLGTQFHQIIQQQALGLEIQPLLQANPQLQTWFNTFECYPPPMIAGKHFNEFPLTFLFADFVFVAVYDLLIEGETDLQIIDWKTYQSAPKLEVLAQRWQSKLYPFLLAETRQHPPEQISMTYWFTEALSDQRHWITLPYSTASHEAIRQELASLVLPLQGFLSAYKSQQADFPQVNHQLNRCMNEHNQCAFIYHCQRQSPSLDWLNLTDIEAIAEIALP